MDRVVGGPTDIQFRRNRNFWIEDNDYAPPPTHTQLGLMGKTQGKRQNHYWALERGNYFCLSKIYFRSDSVNPREGDFRAMNSQIKSWIFSNQMESPEELLLYRTKSSGGLGIVYVK